MLGDMELKDIFEEDGNIMKMNEFLDGSPAEFSKFADNSLDFNTSENNNCYFTSEKDCEFSSFGLEDQWPI